ncbi:d6.1 [Tranosema rostrale ichnovirus]|nr:d6.1 [Tranosema rostrale ichnovirus]
MSNVKNFEATFYNGRRLHIQYVFDPEKMGDARLRVNVNSLSPVFGGIVPLGGAQFMTLSKISNFGQTIHLDDCSAGINASCSCRYNIPKDEEDLVHRCEYDHFHHYCALHLGSWLQYYLERSILLQESKKHYYQRMAEIYGPTMDFYYTVGSYANSQHWLKYARSFYDCRRV